ncbi:MAG: Ser-Thr-rich GPI-anchored membrane family protein [Bacteroidales bacterium]|nr:Ser-Thr-rich GPI-anchored membrane family protein [Bacteroidales bacterium]
MKKLILLLISVFFTVQIFSQSAVVQVITPNGGENWTIGCPSVIHWISSNTAGPVKIELFKSGNFYMTIASQVPAGINTFTWIPPFNTISGNDFKVKITCITSVAGFDFSDGNFSINMGTLTVGSPNGGETWVKGTMHPILWTDNICDNVRIELWKGGVFNSVIAASVPSNGSFNWVIPNVNTLVPDNDYKVKIMSLANATGTTSTVHDFSDNNFTILPGQNTSQITIITPNGGENWIIGCPSVIHWVTTTAATGSVKIELFKNNLYYKTIASQVPAGVSSFTWIVPYSVVPGNNYKVKVSSLTNTTGFDFSDNDFTIHLGNITVGSPNGGETWVKGTMHPILWTDNICDNVRIELWKGGVFNSVIAASVPSTGTFHWMIPNVTTLVPGNDYKVKIMSLSLAGSTTNMVFDFSDNDFTIAGGSPVLMSRMSDNIIVFPNPFSTELYVNVAEASDSPVTFEIVNINGGLILLQTSESMAENETVRLNTSAIPNGKYLLIVKKGTKVISSHQIFLIR